MVDLTSARDFVHGNARLLELRVFAALFEGGDAGMIVPAVAAYQNEDGGFGHGLEPDKRCPASQPLDVEIALERLVIAGDGARPLALRACDFLTTVATHDGAVPVVLPSIAGYPRAAHWAGTDEYEPSLNPTASIAGHLHALGVEHQWLDRATEWSFSTLERDGPPPEAHTIKCIVRFFDHVPDQARVAALVDAVASALPECEYFRTDPEGSSYGLTPTDFASSPDSRWRAWFDDLQFNAHVDRLARDQQPDGGWPLAWQPPSPATECEWRAIKTIHALQVLRAYGRLDEPDRAGAVSRR